MMIDFQRHADDIDITHAILARFSTAAAARPVLTLLHQRALFSARRAIIFFTPRAARCRRMCAPIGSAFSLACISPMFTKAAAIPARTRAQKRALMPLRRHAARQTSYIQAPIRAEARYDTSTEITSHHPLDERRAPLRCRVRCAACLDDDAALSCRLPPRAQRESCRPLHHAARGAHGLRASTNFPAPLRTI